MAFADFSTGIVEISPGKALILKVYAGCIYKTVFIGYGLCKDVVTYPHYRASYAVPVRPYRLLQSCFLQTSGHPERPYSLLMGFANSPIKDLHPLDNQCKFLAEFNTCHAGHTQFA